ncbi:hypothetical protein Lmor_1141 [Legionella moravica]|uniref:Opacity protein and related surface antigens n=1 Tax=Legionella moravica TaxID=39962 RepID=A0A378JRI6_9GAMM|nr:outer membrane beta-barrel protein [Legionella moravica]KTD34608.1 hypothetical protein Lmor_1141 [Legionella moravica]STX61214.1 Opacity protein and related surface antigens [Legionella moravica]
MLKRIMIAGLGASFSMSVSAAELVYQEEIPVLWSSIITLSGGASWASPGQNQYLYPEPIPHFDYYAYNSKTGVMGNAEIFFGLQRMVRPNILGELGLGVAGASDAKVTGTVNVDGVPDFYSFQYKVNHVRVEMKGRLIGNLVQPVQPYISGSFGAGFNNSHGFNSLSVNPYLYPSPWFADSTTIAFSYTLGAGVQLMLNPNWQVAVGYEWGDWGKSYLGDDGNTISKGPRLSHLYTNELLFSLSYLFT